MRFRPFALTRMRNGAVKSRSRTIPRRSRFDDRKDPTHDVHALARPHLVRNGVAHPLRMLDARPIRLHDLSSAAILLWSSAGYGRAAGHCGWSRCVSDTAVRTARDSGVLDAISTTNHLANAGHARSVARKPGLVIQRPNSHFQPSKWCRTT